MRADTVVDLRALDFDEVTRYQITEQEGLEINLSELIENYLKVVLEDSQQKVKLSPSIKKLKGAIKLPEDFDYKKELTESLSAKYKI